MDEEKHALNLLDPELPPYIPSSALLQGRNVRFSHPDKKQSKDMSPKHQFFEVSQPEDKPFSRYTDICPHKLARRELVADGIGGHFSMVQHGEGS